MKSVQDPVSPAPAVDAAGSPEGTPAGPNARRLGRVGAWALVAGALAFVAFGVTLTRTPPVWLDEAVYASTAYSFVLNGSGVPTVVAENRTLLPWHLFYGPLYPSLGALCFRAFGFSIYVFRGLSLVGSLLAAAAGGFLVQAVERNRNLGLLAFGLIALTPEIGSRATSGKMDPLVVAFELAGLAMFVVGVRQTAVSRAALATSAAAAAWSCAGLASPRALVFFASMTLCVPAAIAAGGAARVVAMYAAAGLLTAGAVALWTLSEAMTPLVWLHVLSLSAVGNTYDVSPLLVGAWAFNF
jgi:hypothetical protein